MMSPLDPSWEETVQDTRLRSFIDQEVGHRLAAQPSNQIIWLPAHGRRSEFSCLSYALIASSAAVCIPLTPRPGVNSSVMAITHRARAGCLLSSLLGTGRLPWLTAWSVGAPDRYPPAQNHGSAPENNAKLLHVEQPVHYTLKNDENRCRDHVTDVP